MTTFINKSERYGDAVEVSISDYLDLNPSGEFEERWNGIYENVDGQWTRIAEIVEEVEEAISKDQMITEIREYSIDRREYYSTAATWLAAGMNEESVEMQLRWSRERLDKKEKALRGEGLARLLNKPSEAEMESARRDVLVHEAMLEVVKSGIGVHISDDMFRRYGVIVQE